MRTRILLLCFGASLVGCGSESDSEETSTAYTFTTDIEPILKGSCSDGSTCHGTGEAGTNYVGNKAAFVAAAATVLQRIDATDATKMPQVGSSKTLSDDNKKKIKSYLGQSVKG